MIIENSGINIDQSELLEEMQYKIENNGMIFDILRSKMYSDPIGSICREIACNSRDAHREVGKANLPIEIYLPNKLESVIKFRDFGPGISPDRIKDVYISYAASTKRDSNVQTGGFGLGAKTPFAYTDSFTVITRVDGIEYNYACYIDESKIGKVALISKVNTDLPNGTDICISVKSNDYQLFNDAIVKATQYWDVRPNIFGGSLSYPILTKELVGSNWFSTTKTGKSTLNVLLDNIGYEVSLYDLDLSQVQQGICFNNSIHLVMNTGDISISSNRETLHFNDKTKSVIKERLKIVESEFLSKINEKLKSIDDYLEAIEFSRRYYFFYKNMVWKGVSLTSELNISYYSVGCETNYSIFSINSFNGKVVVRGNGYRIDAKSGANVLIDDVGIDKITNNQAKKILANLGSDSVQIITDGKGCKNYLKDLAQIHIDLIKTENLSSYLSKSAVVSKKTPLIISKLNHGMISRSSISEVKLSKNPVLAFYAYGDKRYLLVNGKKIDPGYIHNSHFNDYDIFVVADGTNDAKIDSCFKGAVLLDDLIKEKISNLDFSLLEYNRESAYYKFRALAKYILPLLIDNSSTAYSFLSKLWECTKIDSSTLKLYNVYIITFNNDPLLGKYSQDKNKFNKKYPLIDLLRVEGLNYKDIADYINLVDSKG